MAEAVAELIGKSVAIRAMRDEVQSAARSDAKVLITGESGVGKEVAARSIHRLSARAGAPFVTINCAGVSETLLESELFGHVRGSFTGAYRDRVGLLEMANRGTIFMDEIGEMSQRMQALLLRFLEAGEIQRVGTDRSSRINVRVIAATNRDLVERIRAAAFREDLYYRLNVIHVTMPPLRERRADIPALLQHFFRSYAEHYGVTPPQPSDAALAPLVAYNWPGNVRELKNVVERLFVRVQNGVITPEDLPPEILKQPVPAPATADLPRPSAADIMFERIVKGAESFWSVAYEPFMARDITREDLRLLVSRGLEHTRGNYKGLMQLFNMAPSEYKRFLNVLTKHNCHVAFQPFRVATGAREKASSSVLV